MTNIKMKNIYNLGLAAVVFSHIPVGICYLCYITVNQLADASDWVIGIVYALAATGYILGFLTYVVYSDRNSKWRFDEAALKRFKVEEKIARKNIKVDKQINHGPLAMIKKLKDRK